MDFKRINNITGWLICLIACTVYIMTMEATGSFWDCGEFVSSCYKLQIPHPPGAPLFVLMGRIFTIPFDAKHAATGVNLMSALASGFTILFLFWSITHFARKIVQKDGQELDNDKIFGVIAAGVVGALAYTFSDSFWYSAVEGEVYALSSFFTAVVFWAMLKWEQDVDNEKKEGIHGNFTRADRWIILIFYLMGLSVGVHLLNLLTIPAIVVIYYFKRYKATTWGTIIAFLVGCFITGMVQKVVIQWSIKGAGSFDIFFVNSFGMPFFSGFAFFFIFVGAIIYLFIRYANKNNYNFLKLGLWSAVFMLLGYSTYFTTLLRSNADPTVDMFNVDNPVNLVGYLSREQYGDWPILYGQDFTAQPEDLKTEETYIKTKDRYELNGRKTEYVYSATDKHFFPRMWDQSNDQGHADYYAQWMGIGKDKQGNYERPPTMAENISFFMQYQVNWMYWRYFMWNFAGKQNDLQGIDMGNVRDGNWKTGIGFYDKLRLGDSNVKGSDDSKIPDSIKNNKANNSLFMLPLLLGILGLVYHIMRDKKDALIVGLLFFFTGFAIVLYLNQAGNQPRERDYAYVGSFYAFAIWIGLGVLWVKEVFAGFIKNKMAANLTAAALCTLAVPVLMASQEWDDHDRSRKVLARDLATDYLESCAPNAILISFGDNDTYPLWYAQEVEGVRRDVRVINASLLGTDWYINQLRYTVNKSAPIDPLWTAEQIEGAKRDYIINEPVPGVDPNLHMDLYKLMKEYAGSEDRNRMVQLRGGDFANVFPTRLVSVPVDIAQVRRDSVVNPTDSVVSELRFEIPKRTLYKNDAAILNIIAANKWKRPIYFTSDYGSLGFGKYLRQDGLTYRLVPVENDQVNNDRVYDVMMQKFVFGNADKPGVYYDEENRRHLISIRMAYANAAISLAAKGRKEEAKKMLGRCDSMMHESNFPYGMVSRGQQHNEISKQMLVAAYMTGDNALADKITKSLKKDLEQQRRYYAALEEVNKADALRYDDAQAKRLLEMIQAIEAEFKNPKPAPQETGAPIGTPPPGVKPPDSPGQ
jgi:hypothetical protein